MDLDLFFKNKMFYQIKNPSINEILNKLKVEDSYPLFLIVEQSILEKKVEQCLELYNQEFDIEKNGMFLKV